MVHKFIIVYVLQIKIGKLERLGAEKPKDKFTSQPTNDSSSLLTKYVQ